MSTKHAFTSPITDGGDPDIVGPDEWNEPHEDTTLAPYALTHPLGVDDQGTSLTFLGNGGSVAAPIYIPTTLILQSLTFRQAGPTGDQDFEWRLYEGTNDGTLSAVTGADGSLVFNVTGNTFQTIDASGAPVIIQSGMYWLVLRNRRGVDAFVNGRQVTVLAGIPSISQSKTLGSALPSSLDMVTGWTKQSQTTPWYRLDGRVFGQSTAF